MKKYLFILLFLASSSVFAQNGLFMMNYEMSTALGAQRDFVDKFSWGGFGLEGRGFIQPNISVGGGMSWNVFNQQFDLTAYQVDENTTFTGKVYRYINIFPLVANAHYYFGTPGETRLYVGVGVGAARAEQRNDFGIWTITVNSWNFVTNPEVGVLMPLGGETYFHSSLRFTYAPSAKGSVNYSYLSLRVGFAFGQ